MKKTAFAYKQGSSFLHRTPSWIKITLIPILNILVFTLPFEFSAALLLIQTALAFYLRFAISEQLRDLKPIIYYALILIAIGFISSGTVSSETFIMLAKLFCIMQAASLLFKTSTTLEIREGIGKIESALRKTLHLSKKNTFTETLSQFICFLPMVFRNWELAKKAWFARGGRYGIRMFAAIFPVFFSVGIKQAYNMSKAVAARSANTQL